MKFIYLFRSLPAVVITSMLLLSCSSSTGPSDDDEGETNQKITEQGVDAELGDETEYIDDETVESAMTEADNENQTYSFNQQALADAGIELEVGEVLLISKVALGRITSVSENNGQVQVKTEFVALNEAFENADIEWNQTFEFTDEVLEKSVMVYKGKEYHPKEDDTACAGLQAGCIGWSFDVGEYNLKGRIVGQGAEAEVIVIMSKQVGGENVAFRAESTIQSIDNYTNIQIRDHETQKFDFSNPNMRGVAKLSLAAAAGGFTQDLGFGPYTMIRFPYAVGPIPVVLAIKVRTVAKLDVQSSASATASVTFSYGGSAGLTYDGKDITINENKGLENPQISEGAGDLAAAIGLNVNAQWGFTAPELELQLFGNVLVPYLRPEFFLGANLWWGPVCQNVNVRYNVSSGIDLHFLGKSLSTLVETPVVEEQRWDYSSPENCHQQHQQKQLADQGYLIFRN
ncbi:hypothetical protein [Rhodohalobacter sp. 614A]|uniref:hypothetical protein n=1 Tax=Rhodohalobacter sp. 614A TaxID=2908649 RepID=UPI001F36892A|nr:hypothetical protein [Rhodohalobacter sp. 614A]